MPHLKLKRTLGEFWPAQSNGRKIILLYHSVGEAPWAMRVQHFHQQIDWLSDYCHIVSLTDLITAKPNPDIQVAITFDDGYVSLFEHVAPKLAEKKIGATVYINTGWIAEEGKSRHKSVAELGHYPDEEFLTWQEVKKLHEASWEIGSHGVNHYNFAQVASDVMWRELALSKQHIENNLGTTCKHFAYPWGRYSSQVKTAASQIGYQYAAAAYHAPLKTNSDLFALPRLNIPIEYSFEDFKNVVLGKWDYLGLLHKMKGL